MERIGQASEEMFARYVEAIFKFAGFATERDRLFPTGNLRHEIDIYAESDFASVAIECKDWQFLDTTSLKKELDAFIAKTREVGAFTGVFVMSSATERLEKYRDYLRNHGLTFWDNKDTEKWHDGMVRCEDKSQYQRDLCDSLGILLEPPTSSEKTYGFLRRTRNAVSRAAIAIGKIISDLSKRKRRRENNRRKLPDDSSMS